MAATANAQQPFTAFNFAVEITRDGDSKPLCNAAFSECDGLEMTLDVKTIREGGNNDRQIRLAGGAAYGALTLKRGLTGSFDLWNWVHDTVGDPGLRASAEVVLLGADGATVQARFILSRCIPLKLKAPALNAKDGTIAVEELQLAYEALEWRAPQS
jgi:phage tail-like protein